MSPASPPPVSRRAIELIAYLERSIVYPYARLTGWGQDGERDYVDLEVEPELAQIRTVPIADVEPVRLLFDPDDSRGPEALALRDDFPLDLVHTNYTERGQSCWLCLWEEPWIELRTRLTPDELVQRIRTWFARAADGDLHRPGQALEPLLQSAASTLIFPPVSGGLPSRWHVARYHERPGRTLVELGTRDGAGASAAGGLLLFPVVTPAVTQRAFRRMPRTLADLEGVVREFGGAFLEELSVWVGRHAGAAGSVILILLQIPLVRDEGGAVEAYDIRAFSTLESLAEVGVKLGRFYPATEGHAPAVRIAPGEAAPDEVGIGAWRVVQRLDRAAARRLSGSGGSGSTHVTAVGAGTLGSNVIVNSARTGFATWSVIDTDVTFPHNGVRQAQGDAQVAQPKAAALQPLANAALAEPSVVEAIDADLLAPGAKAAEIEAAFARADLVLDLTASPAALRHIAGRPEARRAASLFLNPAGTDLVLLAEDPERSLRLDELEAQYFWAIARQPGLETHLDIGRIDFIRYSNACQDISRPLPPWQVQTLAGIAARQVECVAGSAEAQIAVWRLSPDTAAVETVAVTPSPVGRVQVGDWSLTLPESLMEQLAAEREAALPAETGGVLVGTVDHEQRGVHILGALKAPADSERSPRHFIRGAEGLEGELATVGARTAGLVAYLGEWHSHTADVPALPSEEDEALFDHLARHMGPAARPFLMAIRSRDGLWLRLGRGSIVEGEIAIPVDGATGRPEARQG